MLLLSFLTKSRFPITAKIQALIDKFGDIWISKQFQKYFWKRVRLLKKTDLFGDGFDYLSDEFMKKFPKFEVLFVKIWVLIHNISFNIDNKRGNPVLNEYTYIMKCGHHVYITCHDDSVQIVIPNCDYYPLDDVENFTIS
jgi:hypothetical protein